jgi:hypothetical protein
MTTANKENPFQKLNDDSKINLISSEVFKIIQELYNMPQAIAKYTLEEQDIELFKQHINKVIEFQKSKNNKLGCTCYNCFDFHTFMDEFGVVPELFFVIKAARSIAEEKYNKDKVK